jgi:hypothetical protein
MTLGVLLAGVVLTTQPIGVSGDLPPSLESAGRVSWLAAGDDVDDGASECALLTPRQWTCPSVAWGASGVAVMFGERSIGYALVGPHGVFETGVADWGRLIRAAPGGVGPEELRGLRVSAWTPDRPPGRPQTRKLGLAPDSTVQVRQLSETSFWIAGAPASPEALLRVEGAAIASTYVLLTSLAGGSSDTPFVIDAAIPLTISGRVESPSGQAIENAQVELFARMASDGTTPQDRQSLEKATLLRLETTHTDVDGHFEIAGLEVGLYQIVAVDFSLGRAELWTSAAGAPVLIKLAASATITGRVLRRKLPAPDIRVRFVPDASAWRASVDPAEHLAAESTTDEGGRFTMPLPPMPAGIVQFIAPDGASTRISVPSSPKTREIVVGDVALPEPTSVEVRADILGCRLSAVGPIGGLGLAVVHARSASNVYWFDFPETGQWFLDAECSGERYATEPQAVSVTASGRTPTIDIHIVTRETLNPPPR